MCGSKRKGVVIAGDTFTYMADEQDKNMTDMKMCF